jgi:capsular polysaccharide biosynthesis protein
MGGRLVNHREVMVYLYSLLPYATNDVKGGFKIDHMSAELRQSHADEFIDLRTVTRALARQWPILLAGLLIGGILLFFVSNYFLPKIYLSSVELYVNNMETKVTGDVTTGDIDASRRLSNTYIVVLQNPAVKDRVIELVGGSLTEEDLEKFVSMEAVEDTEVVRISASTEDPALSTRICNAYAEVAPEILERVVEAGSVEIIGAAKPNSEPVSPNIPRNTVVGALAGLLLTVIVLYVASVMDNTVKGGMDLRQRFDVPVLGEIPSFGKGSKSTSYAETTTRRQKKPQ